MAESERLVRRHMPVGGLSRLKELGLDPARYGSCHASDGHNVRGCPFWDSCRFDRKDWGGFKGDRPHNVGYFVRTHEGRKKTDYIACYGFVAALQPRMIEGMSAELRGERHEFIRIIGQEGSEIPIKILREKDLEPGQPWNAPREIIAEFKKIRIPTYPDPATADAMLDYEKELEKLMSALPEMQGQMVGIELAEAVKPLSELEAEGPPKETKVGRSKA